MEALSAGTLELYAMFCINPNPKVIENIVLEDDLFPEELQLVRYLKTGEWPTLPKALYHVNKLPAMGDS